MKALIYKDWLQSWKFLLILLVIATFFSFTLSGDRSRSFFPFISLYGAIMCLSTENATDQVFYNSLPLSRSQYILAHYLFAMAATTSLLLFGYALNLLTPTYPFSQVIFYFFLSLLVVALFFPLHLFLGRRVSLLIFMVIWFASFTIGPWLMKSLGGGRQVIIWLQSLSESSLLIAFYLVCACLWGLSLFLSINYYRQKDL
ncbi:MULTISPECIES: ABC-2 transporter permease [Aerococcus]|uniref:ABC-2 transporter permease n=1 Tax=Aerococcus sanguinicola TaxID=119206 RepID=A0A5N1GEK4_9LACT|nr:MULTISPECIES: ABC-2 transporter permease [Aerococcus]KAA9299262.1 ABC-2 transporter permease [Aerococcus sanguinicola]MDK6370115.1 ABC-2 transporter permease [Aerococcus sp. UMB9870]MDK6680719.1 ABC-2 transporter permease [Aerococcus sp. UMB8608]MDK6687513.1 ABC-2 transporter permease [Aerococcus sp. UMB8623]MDK6940669.1 ABC-2 transporter permease [Aerococcus sp. UMB8487]